MISILDRFLRYVAVDTQSNEESESQPSAEKELVLLQMLRDELIAMGVGGAGVKPQIIKNYDGGAIALEGVPGLKLDPADFPELLAHKGETIITTDGTTLLGADDKAGVAEIMDAVQYIVEHPEFKHGTIKIGFTPDEEIGRGVVKFDVSRFGADYAYTMDGGEVGELEFETM